MCRPTGIHATSSLAPLCRHATACRNMASHVLRQHDPYLTAPPMQLHQIPFGTVDWANVSPTVHPGETGTALWRTQQFGAIRVRMVEYSAGYRADHWCTKGHILLVLEGVLDTELADGRTVRLTAGMSYQVADDTMAHRSTTVDGARLFIVD